jgi:hypothetical protein
MPAFNPLQDDRCSLPEPARGRPARSMSFAGRLSESERALRSAAAATETVARRFMGSIQMRVAATTEPDRGQIHSRTAIGQLFKRVSSSLAVSPGFNLLSMSSANKLWPRSLAHAIALGC